MKTVIIDEGSGNPFPNQLNLVESAFLGFSPASTEGYHHNTELIKETTKKLIDIIGLSSGGKTIDIGYGSNLAVAEAMIEVGRDSYGLDSQDGLNHEKYPRALFVPPHFNAVENGIKKYCGTIEELLHPESELKNSLFDLFTFWGSWESGGYNFAIGGEMGNFRVWEEQPHLKEMYENASYNTPEHEEASDALSEAMQENREKIIADISTRLKPQGGVLVVSSRYAGHGAGFSTDQLPWEKRIMLRLGQTFAKKGAKQVYFMGLSNKTVQTQLDEHENFSDVARALQDNSHLFNLKREVYEAAYSENTIKSITDMNIPLGRIDAVYGRF